MFSSVYCISCFSWLTITVIIFDAYFTVWNFEIHIFIYLNDIHRLRLHKCHCIFLWDSPPSPPPSYRAALITRLGLVDQLFTHFTYSVPIGTCISVSNSKALCWNAVTFTVIGCRRIQSREKASENVTLFPICIASSSGLTSLDGYRLFCA